MATCSPAIFGHFPLPPVRIDMAGGWTDTPPQAYEWGGAVVTLALTVNNGVRVNSTRVVMGTASPGLAASHVTSIVN